MTVTLDPPPGGREPAASPARREATPSLSVHFLALAGVASIAAGVIHAGAIAAHSEHRQAVWAFVAIGTAQLAWGAAAAARPRRWLAFIGLSIGIAAATGWVLAKSRGIPLIDGLDEKEPVRFSDGLAAALAGVIVFGSGLSLLARRLAVPRFLVAGTVAAVVGVTVPGAAAAVDHQHDDHRETAGVVDVPSAVPPRAFDPALPIDLGGVDGVTPEQQARAENLLAATVLQLPQWADPAYAEANGFQSIGDGVTGTEHFINREFMEDATILDPNRPESLVFDVDPSTGERRLSAAMYMMSPGDTLVDVPDIGGALTQWHIHNNLCFTDEGRVAGLTDGEGNCAAPLIKGPETPMIHVWIRSHPCGPFAALEGVGGGQVAEGEAVLCDHVHGS